MFIFFLQRNTNIQTRSRCIYAAEQGRCRNREGFRSLATLLYIITVVPVPELGSYINFGNVSSATRQVDVVIYRLNSPTSLPFPDADGMSSTRDWSVISEQKDPDPPDISRL